MIEKSHETQQAQIEYFLGETAASNSDMFDEVYRIIKNLAFFNYKKFDPKNQPSDDVPLDQEFTRDHPQMLYSVCSDYYTTYLDWLRKVGRKEGYKEEIGRIEKNIKMFAFFLPQIQPLQNVALQLTHHEDEKLKNWNKTFPGIPKPLGLGSKSVVFPVFGSDQQEYAAKIPLPSSAHKDMRSFYNSVANYFQALAMRRATGIKCIAQLICYDMQTGVQIQERKCGKSFGLLNRIIQETDKVDKIFYKKPDKKQVTDFVRSICEMAEHNLVPDAHNFVNFLYDEEQGFSIVDYNEYQDSQHKSNNKKHYVEEEHLIKDYGMDKISVLYILKSYIDMINKCAGSQNDSGVNYWKILEEECSSEFNEISKRYKIE